jgi:hypothetical protein
MRHKWVLEQKSIAKNLVTKWGGDVVLLCIEHVLRNWEDFRKRYNLSGAPSMKLIASYSNSWFPEIQEGKNLSRPSRREKALRQGESKKDGTAGSKGIDFFDAG